ncbi:MAG: response regulator transcription factor [Burkholderiales bacterium]|nr:response regulator transcription factor [Burkholderiales bacterium]
MNHPTAIVAEDEPLLRQELRQALASLWPELTIHAEAPDGIAALRLIEEHAPDVVFLDIEMPGMSGLEVAKVVNGRCHIVFVTAYDKYAVAAFEQQAADYVLKPVSVARLASTLGRLKERMQRAPARLEGLLDSLVSRVDGAAPRYLRWITAAQGPKVKFVTVERVCYFQADNKYTVVMTADSELLIRRPIKELVDELDPQAFWQIHRGTVVNVNEIADVTRDLHGHMRVHLRSRKETLAVSESYNHLFRQM